MKIYSIYDYASSVWNPVFALGDDVAARRYAERLSREEGCVYHDYKNDFGLYCVGEYRFDNDIALPLITSSTPVLVLKFSAIA